MTKFVIVASRQDPAGMNICSFISNLPVHYTEKEIIHAENIDKNLDADFIIFASKHQGKTEKMLSLHAPGNWGVAEMGGNEGKICRISGGVMKTIFKELNENIPDGWNLTLECTHHGPYIEKPCCFVEIGSNKDNWENKEAGEKVAKAIESAVKILQNNKEYKTVIGIGGPHYCPSFNKIQLNSEYAISHIIPEYALPLTEEMIKEAIEKTNEKVEIAIVDWKGTGKSEERDKAIDLLNKTGLKYMRASEVEK